jgi:hypothetical protein
MRIEVAGRTYPLQVEEKESFTSISTGNELQRVKGRVRFVVPDDSEAIDTVSERRSHVATVSDDETHAEFGIRVLSASYSEGDIHRYYVLELEEKEELVPTSIHVADTRLDPAHYEEEASRDVLTCRVRAAMSRDDLERFWQIRGASGEDRYFDVVRPGIAEEPRRMRFGRILWRAIQADEVEALFVLVDRAYDDDPQTDFTLHGPNAEAVQEATARLEILIDRLLDRLEEHSVLKPEEATALRAVSGDDSYERELQFYRVDRFDRWQ